MNGPSICLSCVFSFYKLSNFRMPQCQLLTPALLESLLLNSWYPKLGRLSSFFPTFICHNYIQSNDFTNISTVCQNYESCNMLLKVVFLKLISWLGDTHAVLNWQTKPIGENSKKKQQENHCWLVSCFIAAWGDKYFVFCPVMRHHGVI